MPFPLSTPPPTPSPGAVTLQGPAAADLAVLGIALAVALAVAVGVFVAAYECRMRELDRSARRRGPAGRGGHLAR
ncbi:hypothetical protein [Peterkaempfera bronchialis]|uniref:hypothetical protein n=1 Tax=Peterkaempfera bronchialis TaxID=2126346 RepID=UPI003C2BE59E